MSFQFRIPTTLFLISLMAVMVIPAEPIGACCYAVKWQEEEEDPFAEPQEEEEDPFAEPDPKPEEPQEEEDPFAEPDPKPEEPQEEEEDPFAEPKPKEPMEPQEEEDPFAEPDPKPEEPQEEEEDPFAEPKPKEPMDPQEEEEDPFAEPDPKPNDPKPTDPKPTEPKTTDPKPSEPKSTDPKPTDVKPTEPKPAETKSTEPKPTDANSNASLSPAGSGTKDGSTTKPNMPSTDSNTKPAGSGTKDPSTTGSETTDTAPGLDPIDPIIGADPDTDVDFEKFQNIIREIRTNEQRINQLVISMPVGFPEKRQQQQAQVNALRQRNLTIRDQLLPTAQASFAKFPNTQPQITNYLLQHIQVLLTGRNYQKMPFDPFAALKACDDMVASGVKNAVLHTFGYRANYILNKFPDAGRHAQKAAMLGQQIDPKLFENLKQMHQKYEDEKAMRAEDNVNGNPHVRIEMDCGTMLVELFEDQAPNTVANFITLVQDGFYNGLTFYQVNPTQIALTGSPTNDGKGGPGFLIKSEAGLENARSHFTGTLSMLSAGDNSSGSMFLITKQPAMQYDGRVTPFGRVIEGLENLYKIKIVNRTAALSENDPTQPTKIIRMSVVRKRDHDYQPERITPTQVGG